MYKLHEDSSFIEKTPGYFIPVNSENTDYQQFIQDVAEQGIEIVEGPDVIEPDYATLRQQEYPSREEQLDMMYWDKVNGTNTWEDTIQAIKDKYPKTITGGTTIGEVPAWVQEAADNWTFNKQLHEYVDAVERLEHYVLSEGVPEITETSIISTELVLNEETNEYETKNITEEYVVQKAIKPLEETIEVTSIVDVTKEETIETIPNPWVVKDEKERGAAQAVIDATPQSVIDSINN